MDVALLEGGHVDVKIVQVVEIIAVGHIGGEGLGVDLHDVGGGAAGQLGGQLVMVAVGAAGLVLDGHVGIQGLELLDDLDGGLVAGVAAPPAEAQGHGLAVSQGQRGQHGAQHAHCQQERQELLHGFASLAYGIVADGFRTNI